MFVALAVVTAVSALSLFAAGVAPSLLSLALPTLHLVSLLGSGVLVGTLLGVVIPEGVASVLEGGTPLLALVGCSLVAGFLAMYALEQARILPPSSADSELLLMGSVFNHSLVTGLVVHSLADGVALGAAAASGSVQLQLAVCLAIVIHKIPAALGLGLVLVAEGCAPSLVHKRVAVFALAAPAAAWVVFCVVKVVGGVGATLTGCVLLVSGGTFLNVAVEALGRSSAEGVSDGLVVAAAMVAPLLVNLVKE